MPLEDGVLVASDVVELQFEAYIRLRACFRTTELPCTLYVDAPILSNSFKQLESYSFSLHRCRECRDNCNCSWPAEQENTTKLRSTW